MKLNCDLGESYGAWDMPVDKEIMPLLDQANIACGFHAGDPSTIKSAISLAIQFDVEIGAHPSYPDLQGFGRRSMAMSKTELIDCLHYQLSAIDGLCRQAGTRMHYVKPHGALYNDMMKSPQVRLTVMEAVSSYAGGQTLMIQAHPDQRQHEKEAKNFALSLYFEAFADRRYQDDGLLVSRRESGAVLEHDEALSQVEHLLNKGVIVTQSGQTLAMSVDTLCVHGDTKGAVTMAKAIRQRLQSKND